MRSTIEALVRKAKDGDKHALEELVRRIQDRIYGLALRMLYHPADAEDAAQEILIRIITRLGGFREASAFTTWMYRIAANHLLTTRRRQAEHSALTFEESERMINRQSADDWRESESEAQQRLIVEEMRLSCLQGLLLCLDREHRLAYILGEIFDVTGEQGADILDTTPAAFRKRLSRARIRDFMLRNCSLINSTNPCRCGHQAAVAITEGRLDSRHLIFATHPCQGRHESAAMGQLEEMDELNRVSALFKSHADFAAPKVFVENIKNLVGSGQYEILKR